MDGDSQFNRMIAANTKFLRNARGLSQDDLSLLCGRLSKSIITKVEKNLSTKTHAKNISDDIIDSLAKGLKVPAVTLLEKDKNFLELLNQVSDRLSNFLLDQKTNSLIGDILIRAAFKGPQDQVRAIIMAADYEFKSGNYENAILIGSHATNYEEYVVDNDLYFRIHHNLASAFLVIGNANEVIRIIRERLNVTEDPQHRAKALFLLGSAYTKKNCFEQAESVFLDALQILNSGSSLLALKGRCYQILGEIYKLAGLKEKTKIRNEYFEKSVRASRSCIDISIEANDFICEIYAIKTLAETYYELGDLEESRKLFNDAISKNQMVNHFRKTEKLKLEYWITLCIGDVGLLEAQIDALENIELDPRDMADMYKRAARLAEMTQKHEKATEFYEKAIQMLENQR